MSSLGTLKDRVRRMMDQQRALEVKHSGVWTDSARINHYAINLSETDLLNIKLHTDLIAGESSISYHHQHPPIDPEKFANIMGYRFYTTEVPEHYWLNEPLVPTSPMPVGVNFRGRMINRSISRFQSCISNLYRMGIMTALDANPQRNLIVEIGAGYGGLAHGFAATLKPHTYVIVDLPETLLFSGTYLTINNPNKKIYIYEKETFTPEFIRKGIFDYDFVLLPHFVTSELFALPIINLFINMMSFQEMSPDQIQGYLKLAEAKAVYLYSDNVDRHPFNRDLGESTVSDLLAKHFELFPSREFYDKKVPGSRAAWFFRGYLGVPRGKKLEFPGTGPFLFNSGESKIGGEQFFVTYKDGQTRHKTRKSLTGSMIALARTMFKKIYKEDLRIYFETAK